MNLDLKLNDNELLIKILEVRLISVRNVLNQSKNGIVRFKPRYQELTKQWQKEERALLYTKVIYYTALEKRIINMIKKLWR